MKKLLKDLFFDEVAAGKLQHAVMNKDELYNLLFNGKITLQEYFTAYKK
jgi:hypothetical protein